MLWVQTSHFEWQVSWGHSFLVTHWEETFQEPNKCGTAVYTSCSYAFTEHIRHSTSLRNTVEICVLIQDFPNFTTKSVFEKKKILQHRLGTI